MNQHLMCSGVWDVRSITDGGQSVQCPDPGPGVAGIPAWAGDGLGGSGRD